MTLARKPSKACFPQAIQATLLHVKARTQARQDWAASTSRLGCKHAKARLQARQDWAASTPKTGLRTRPMGERSFPHPETEHAAPASAARSISHRSTLHRPSHRPAFSHRMRSGGQAFSPTLFPTTASAAGRQVMRKWQQAVARPRKKFYLCPYRTPQTEKDR